MLGKDLYGGGIGGPWYWQGFGFFKGYGFGLYQGREDISILFAPKIWEKFNFKHVWKGLGAPSLLSLVKHKNYTFSYDTQNAYFDIVKELNLLVGLFSSQISKTSMRSRELSILGCL